MEEPFNGPTVRLYWLKLTSTFFIRNVEYVLQILVVLFTDIFVRIKAITIKYSNTRILYTLLIKKLYETMLNYILLFIYDKIAKQDLILS